MAHVQLIITTKNLNLRALKVSKFVAAPEKFHISNLQVGLNRRRVS